MASIRTISLFLLFGLFLFEFGVLIFYFAFLSIHDFSIKLFEPKNKGKEEVFYRFSNIP